MSILKKLQDLTAQTDPCETCLRWPECNGVDANTCPLCRWEETKLKAVLKKQTEVLKSD